MRAAGSVRVYLKFVLRNTCAPTLLVASPARVCGCVVNVCKNRFVYSIYFVVCLRVSVRLVVVSAVPVCVSNVHYIRVFRVCLCNVLCRP